MATSILDFILPEDQELYAQIIERAATAKANAPKERKPRAPQTLEQKAAAAQKRAEKLLEKLAALRAAGVTE